MVRFGRFPGGSSRATAWLLTLCMTALPLVAAAQAYQPGDVIEYKVRGAWPVKWERGVFIRELPGGKQVLIHEKPSEFFPKGPEIAFDPLEIRRPGAPAPNPAVPGTKAPADPVGPLPLPPRPREPKRGGAEAALPRDCPAGGLMGKEEVISFAGATIGADPWKNPPRDENLARIRDCIRTRGASFTADADFDARMSAQSSLSSHIGWAVNSNRGPHPKVEDYVGSWLLRAANRGSRSEGTDRSGRATVTTTDSQAESGQLTINADGTYVWKMGRRDPENQWLRGQWREVKPGEGNTWEGGPALWLMQAKQGFDYMVRVGRDPAWPGWIDVGMGVARTPVEYGRRP